MNLKSFFGVHYAIFEKRKITVNVLVYNCDVSDEEKVYECVSGAQKKFGKISFSS